MKIKELLNESGKKVAYEMGYDDAKSNRPKKGAGASFGPYAQDYYNGYTQGQADNDHIEWQEKTAAKRQGIHY